MKKLLAAGLLLAGLFGANAQNVASTTTLTSGGNLAGSLGGNSCTYYGANAGRFFTGTTAATGSNTFIGQNSGNSITSGNSNTYTGYKSGYGSSSSTPAPGTPGYTVTGNSNSFYGASSGIVNNGGNENAFFGASAGYKNNTGSNNTYLGFSSGSNNAGSGNVFVGSNVGPTANQLGSSLSNNLFIDNSTNSNPLIWGDFAADQLKLNGKVAIGGNNTTPFGTFPTSVGGVSIPNYTLFVKGGLLTEEMRVALATTWADYVFAKDYNLKPLSEVEEFINENGHLPNVPSAAQVKDEGINVGEMARIQQEKIEELTLYIIAQNKRIEALEAKMGNK
ncbi:hypothetical protein [Flavobacterium wongokense]|uniref:hypothetical protein n=1 Tax=Flavobacterium wongokense TaxID=2910674 RepID=UPI001F338D33|nr:hypothetical protein [Flavobacterium sp. WG47]MCF6130834.1 hypothetical protein [Flavobacterium sp. WG47]